MKISDLITVLRSKDPNADVEFIVVTTKGKIVTMLVEATASGMRKALKLFGGPHA